MAKARRVTVYEAHDGWRFRVQGGNWRTIDASEEGKENKARVIAALRRKYKGVELVIEEAA